MQNGEVDFLSGIKNVSAESYAQMEQTDGYGAQVDEKSLQTYYVGYNLSSEIFGDQVVREAISSAIDKDAVVDNIYGGLFDKADAFFSRDLPYCDVEQTVYGFDLDHANQILDEAGYVDTDGDGIREKDGVKLSAAFLYQTGTASDDNMVVYICDQASKIGIELTPQSAQMMDWYAMIQSGDYGLTIFKTQGGYYDPAMVITNINPSTSMDPILMQIGASQPELAALVDELDSATDEARIQEIYNTILTTMADQCLTTPLIYTRQLAIYSDAVASYTFPTDASHAQQDHVYDQLQNAGGGVHMYVMAKVPKAGVVLIMNLFVAIAFVAFGELANLLLGSLIVCSILAEIIRKWAGYKNYKGIVMSYILLSLSNIGSPLYVWVFSDYAISEASEEMSANYAEILSTLTSPWFMVLAIAATVVISIIVGVIAKKVYNKQFANAGIM